MDITIKNTDIKKQKDIESFLYHEAEKNHLFYIRKDIILKSGGDVNSIEFGVYGDVVSNIEKLKLSYLGSSIFTQDNLNKLLQSTNKNTTLGLEISSVDMIEPIASFVFGDNVAIKKLDELIENSKTIDGKYKILGLTSSNKESFLKELSDLSGIDRSTFTDNLSEQYIDNSFQESVLIILLIVHSLVLLSLLCYLTIDKLNLLGKLVLQGGQISYLLISHMLYL